VKWLVDQGADIDCKDTDGVRPWHEAARFGELEAVKWLVEQKEMDVNVKNKYGWTAFHSGSRFGELKVMKLSEEKGADINMKDND